MDRRRAAGGAAQPLQRRGDRHRPRGHARGRRTGARVRGARRRAPTPHDRPRARGHPAPRGRPRRRAGRGPGGDDLARERQGDHGGPRRGGPRRRPAAALRVRGHPGLRRQPAARRERRRRPASARLHAAPAVRRRGAITPFNYPLLLVLHKIAPALAAGNAVVLKPARQTPLTALKLVEILLEAGLPPEAISCVTGPGGELGDALVRDPRVRKISFTGSTTTGEAIARAAGVKKLSLELGASCPVAILPDADIELAAQAVALGGYANAGQVCISVQRVLADSAIVSDFLDALVPKVAAISAGDPNRADIGSLISEEEARRVEAALREGTRANGAH